MALPMTFRRRKKLHEKGDTPDVYHYDKMNEGLRVQIVMKMDEVTSLNYYQHDGRIIYSTVVPVMRQEKKAFALCKNSYENNTPREEFLNWFIKEPDLEYLLSGLEIFMQTASKLLTPYESSRDTYLEEMNELMLEDCFGYQFINGYIIKLGSEYIHKEVVVPLLHLISGEKYNVVNAEFRKAHEEFRKKDYEDCIHDCCNAFESMGKVIALDQGWTELSERSTAKDIVKAIFDHQFIPSYMQQEFTGLRTILESGINTVRNRAGGHGAGVTLRNIEKHIAEFQMNQTAAALKLLAEYNR